MQQTSEISQARKALLEQYLRGELSAKISQHIVPAETQSLVQNGLEMASIPASVNPGESADAQTRVTVIQMGNGKGPGAKTPFFFLHGDWTGNAVFCYALARELGADQPFYAIDTYDFGPYEVLPDLATIAAEQLKMIRAVQPEGPYQLGGFCNGALIAYEMARQLQSSGQTVDVLILMDAIPSRYRGIRKVIARIGSWMHWSQRFQLACFLHLQHLFRLIADRGKVEDYEFIKAHDRRITSLFPPVETLRREFAAMFIWATALYEPEYYTGKVTLLWDEAEPIRSLWWQKMAYGKDSEVEVYQMPGSHATCKTDQVQGMAALVAKSLQQVHSQS